MNDTDIHARSNPRKSLPARRIIAGASERRLPKMHWRWRQRGRDIEAILYARFGAALPNNEAGMDAAEIISQHYMGLNVNAEPVTRANLRIWARWLTAEAVTRIIGDAGRAKKPPQHSLARSSVSPPTRFLLSDCELSSRSQLRFRTTATDKLAEGEKPAPQIGVVDLRSS